MRRIAEEGVGGVEGITMSAQHRDVCQPSAMPNPTVHERKASQRNINKNALSSLRPALHLVRQHMGHFQITEHDMNTRKTAERCCHDDKQNKSLHLKVIRARFPI